MHEQCESELMYRDWQGDKNRRHPSPRSLVGIRKHVYAAGSSAGCRSLQSDCLVTHRDVVLEVRERAVPRERKLLDLEA